MQSEIFITDNDGDRIYANKEEEKRQSKKRVENCKIVATETQIEKNAQCKLDERRAGRSSSLLRLDDNNNNNSTAPTGSKRWSACGEPPSHHQTIADDSTSSSSKQCEAELKQLNQATQQVLDVLDQQICSLNALKQRSCTKADDSIQKTDHLNRNGYLNCHAEYHNRNNNHLARVNDSESSSYLSSASLNTRRLLLDYYIKHNIEDDDEGECGCQFNHYQHQQQQQQPSKSNVHHLNLLSALNECSATEYEGNREAQLSSFSGSEISIANHATCCTPDTGNVADVCLLEEEEEEKGERFDNKLPTDQAITASYYYERHGHGLFIDGSHNNNNSPLSSNNKVKATERLPTTTTKSKTDQPESNTTILVSNGLENFEENYHSLSSSYYASGCQLVEHPQENHHQQVSSELRKKHDIERRLLIGTQSIAQQTTTVYAANDARRLDFEQTGTDEEDDEPTLSETGNVLESLSDSLDDLHSPFSPYQQHTNDATTNFSNKLQEEQPLDKPDYEEPDCPRQYKQQQQNSLTNYCNSSNSLSWSLQLGDPQPADHSEFIEKLGQQSSASNTGCYCEQLEIVVNNRKQQPEELEANSSQQLQPATLLKQADAINHLYGSRQALKRTRKRKQQQQHLKQNLAAPKVRAVVEQGTSHSAHLSWIQDDDDDESAATIAAVLHEISSANTDDNGQQECAKLVDEQLQTTTVNLEDTSEAGDCYTARQASNSKQAGNLIAAPSDPATTETRNRCCLCETTQDCCSRCSLFLSPTYALLNDCDNEDFNSMRAVKDIAKMSVPSLSALQYLPSHLDAKNKNPVSVRNRSKTVDCDNNQSERVTNNKSEQLKCVDQKLTIDMNKTTNAGTSSTTSVKVITESDDDDKHDESCLLHRLCLCNCMARSHHQQASDEIVEEEEEDDDDDNESSSRATSSKTTGRKSPSQVKGGHYEQRSSSRASASSSNEEELADISKRKAANDSRRQISSPEGAVDSKKGLPQIEEYEKQSPSFLNLLSKSSANISRNLRERSNLANKQQQHRATTSQTVEPERFNRGEQHIKATQKASSGSAGDLVASSSNASSNSRNSSTLSSTFLRGRSTSFTTNAGGSTSSRNGVDPTLLDTPQRPQSACSVGVERDNNTTTDKPQSIKQHQQANKISQSYKKFLSPGRLFASPSAGAQQEPSITRATTPETDHSSTELSLSPATSPTPSKSPSFLTRSLNRLSHRARLSPKKSKKQRSTANESEATTKQQVDEHPSEPTTTCVSPSISISTFVSNQDSLTDSINSLDTDIILDGHLTSKANRSQSHSSVAIDDKASKRLQLAPEITLNRVEYTGVGGDYYYCSPLEEDMTRSSSYKYNRHQQQVSTTSSAAHQLHQYSGSNDGERSDNFTTSEYNGSERAYSLPTSPSMLRRNNNGTTTLLGSDRNRSPRLNHSPVPFRSPATHSTQIEDGLKVCSTEHFEKHIGNIRGNQVDAQKRLFKAWINHFCPNLIQRDLVEEFKDGIKLIGLLAALTRDKHLLRHYEKLNRDKQSYINRIVTTPSSRLRQLSNVSIAIDYLRQSVGMKLINLNPMDIVSGKPNVILGLCWNIILNFQLEQNFLRYLESCDVASSLSSSSAYSNSRLSYGSISEVSAASKKVATLKNNDQHRQQQHEEYTPGQLVLARKRLLDHINKRFNLELTNLTSNLLDGDVLMVIIKNLIQADRILAHEDKIQLNKNWEGKLWKRMGNDEKLDHCFGLAQTYLNVPRLFSAADLKQQSISDNCSKPLLVYLSMLLCQEVSADHSPIKPSSPESHLSDHQQATTADSVQLESNDPSVSLENKIKSYLEDIDSEDKFELDKLHSTLVRIGDLQKLVDCKQAEAGESGGLLFLDQSVIDRIEKLKEQATQIQSLILWINKADNLFETTHKSAADLATAIEMYQKFFSPSNVPQVKTTPLCSTLERQYRECLGTAKQRVLLMEQTLKNWISYENSRKQLKDWLATAESKLTDALQQTSMAHDQLDSAAIEQHTGCLEDLIDYFELEPIDVILNSPPAERLVSSSTTRSLHDGLASLDSLVSSNLLGVDDSFSTVGSVHSLGSVSSSRVSTLQSSKKAAYHKLFDNFELKCRLLAAQLDTDQKEALLLGVKELRSRLKYITDQRVPQVVSELRYNINQFSEISEPSNAITTEFSDAPTESMVESEVFSGDDDVERSNAANNNDHSIQHQESSLGEQEEVEKPHHQENQIHTANKPVKSAAKEPYKSAKLINTSKNTSKKPQTVQISGNKKKANKSDTVQRQSKQQEQPVETQNESKVTDSWSLLGWFMSRNKDSSGSSMGEKQQARSGKKKRKNKPSQQQKGKSHHQKVHGGKKDVFVGVDDDEFTKAHSPPSISYTRLLWTKFLRASRASLSLNIVLLICLAGICVVPLIQRDACCELSDNHIPSIEFNLNEKPT